MSLRAAVVLRILVVTALALAACWPAAARADSCFTSTTGPSPVARQAPAPPTSPNPASSDADGRPGPGRSETATTSTWQQSCEGTSSVAGATVENGAVASAGYGTTYSSNDRNVSTSSTDSHGANRSAWQENQTMVEEEGVYATVLSEPPIRGSDFECAEAASSNGWANGSTTKTANGSANGWQNASDSEVRSSCGTGLYLTAAGQRFAEDLQRCSSDSRTAAASSSSASGTRSNSTNHFTNDCRTGRDLSVGLNGTGSPLDATALDASFWYTHLWDNTCSSQDGDAARCTSVQHVLVDGNVDVRVPALGVTESTGIHEPLPDPTALP